MAEGSQDIILSVAGDTRQLEKDIQRIVSSSSLNLNTKGFSQPLGKITGQLGEFEKSLAASNARVIAFGVSAGAIYAVEKAFSEMIKTTIQVEKSLAEINTILNVSQKELGRFGNSLFDLAKNTGQSFDIVAKSALEFSRQGLGINETLKRTSDALVLTRLSGLDVVSSTESITAALNSFNQTVISSNELINKLIAVDTGFAVSSADLAEAIKRVGSSAQDAGVSLDELVALVTSAQQITSRGGSVIGNSFKTIFTRLQRPDVLAALEELGVKTKDAEGNIMPLIQILGQLSTKFESLAGTQKSQIAELVGGVFQINILKAALGDLSKEYSIFNQALETSMGATDEANKRNEQLNQTLSATLNQTLVNLTKSASDIGNLSLGPVIQKTLNGLNSALENFSLKNGENDGVGAKIGEGIARGIGNFLGGPGIALALIALTKVFERLKTYSVDAFKSLSGMNNASMQQSQIQAQVLNIIGKNPQLIEQINKGNVDTANLHRQILSLIEQETINMQKQIGIASTLAKSLSAAGVGVAQTGALKGLVVSNKAKALGYIPNFNKENQIEEMGAAFGGYKAGSIRKTYLPKEGLVTYNSAETLVRYPGFEQEAILPPKRSKAGKEYRDNFIEQHGFDPYSPQKAFGYIPNFAGKKSINNIPKDYIRIQGDFADSLTDHIGRVKPEYQSVAYAQGRNVYINRNQQDDLLKNFKIKEEKNLLKRDQSTGISAQEYVLVYPSFGKSGVGKTSAIANKYMDKPLFQFSTFGFPGSRTNIGEELFKDVSEKLVGASARFVSSIATSPKLVDDTKFINSVRSNLNRSVIESALGGVFEAGIKSSIGSIVDDPNAPLDLSEGELKTIAEKFINAAPLAGGFVAGDLKNALNPANAISMANKIANHKGIKKDPRPQNIRNKSFGFIPNFSAIQDAINREEFVSGNKAKVLWSDTLGTPVVVNNSQTAKYGKNADKIIKNDHINQGQLASKANLMKTGSGKERYKSHGFIPNFAKSLDSFEPENEISRGIGNLNRNGRDKANSELEKFIGKLISLNKNTDQIDMALKEVAEKFKKTGVVSEKFNKNLEKTVDNIKNDPPILSNNTGLAGKIKNNFFGAFKDENLPENVQNFKNKLVFASFGLSMVGGFASSLAGEDKKLATSIDSFTQSIGTAATAMGYIPGHAGIAIGALIGAAGAINSLTSLLFDKAPELEKTLDKVKDENSNFANGTQKYSAVLQKLTEAYNNPKAKSSDLLKLNKELIEAAREIPSAYRLQLLAIQDNTKLQEEITKIQKELVQKQKGLEFAAKTQKAIDDNTIEKFGRFSSEIGKGIFGTGDNFIQKIGASISTMPIPGLGGLTGASRIFGESGKLTGINASLIIEDLFQKMRGSTLIKNNAMGENMASGVVGSFSREGLSKFEETFKNPNIANSLRALSGGDFINKMQRDFGLDKNVAETLRNASPEDIKRLREQIIKLGSDASKTAEVLKQTEKAREDLNKKIAAEQKAIERAKSSVDRFKESLEAIAKSVIEFNSYQQKYTQQGQNDKNLLNIEKARGMMEYQKPFLSPFEEAKANGALEELVRRQEFINEAQSIQTNTNSNLMKTAIETLNGMKSKTEDEKIKDVLANLSKLNINTSGQNLSQDIINVLGELGQDFTKGDREKLNTDLNSELNKQSQQLLDLNQKTIQANEIAKAQLAVQKAMASRDVDRAAFGGQSGFGYQDLMSERENLMNKIQSDKIMASGVGQSNTPGFQTGFIKSIVDQIGGFKPGEELQANSIRDMLIKSRTQDILYQGNTLKQAMNQNRQSYDIYGRYNGTRSYSGAENALIDLINKRMFNAKNIASTQVDEAIKTGKAAAALPLNIEGMAGDVKTITGLLQKISSNMDGLISSGVQQAIKDSISNYLMGFNSPSTVDAARNKIQGAQANADIIESIGKKKIEALGIENSKVLNESMLQQEMQRTGNLKQNMENANKQLGLWIENQVNKAISENKPIPTLEELQSQEKKKGSSVYGELNALTKDTGSTDYQAFNSYIENVQKIQQLQEQIKGSIESLNQKQQEIQQEIMTELGTKSSELIKQNKKPDNMTPSGNIMNRVRTSSGQEIVGYTGAPINAQKNYNNSFPPLDRISEILKRIIEFKPDTSSQNNSATDFKNLNQGISELSAVLKNNSTSQPENLNVEGNIDVSPLDIQGTVQVNMNSPTFTVQIDDSDLAKTKTEIERNFDEKLKQLSSNILSQVEKSVSESLRQSIGRASGREMPATTNSPFRNYGAGRSAIG